MSTESQFAGLFARKIPPGRRDFLNMIFETFCTLGKIYCPFLKQKIWSRRYLIINPHFDCWRFYGHVGMYEMYEIDGIFKTHPKQTNKRD